MKRSLAVASAAALMLVLIAAAPASPLGSAKRVPKATLAAQPLTVDSAGYARVPVVAAAPPAADCDSSAEAGRMTFDSSGGTVYVCDGSGWRTLAHS